jgi:uncharacterized cupin superfamily protein
MSTKVPAAFDPLTLPESNASIIPAPFDGNRRRWNRRLGNHAGLTRFGVNLTRVEPGGQTSYRHAHSLQDEFVWVVEGEVVLETDAGEETVTAGHCAGFAHGTGNGHRFVNRTDRDAFLLVVGDRTPGDEVTYPDDDLLARQVDGAYRYTRKDGSVL